MSTFIIAEAGSNHNGSFKQAMSLIDVASRAGVDAVKFQTFKSEDLYSKNTPDFANYKNINQLIKDLEMPREWLKDLKQYCDEKGVEFMSSPFDQAAVDQLVSLGVKRLKIAGFESTDLRFVDMVCSAKLPIIASLGIGSNLLLINRILEIADKHGIKDVTFLHCNNAYPTPPENAFLDTVKILSSDKRYKSGFSDHTMSPFTPALAVAAGAKVIEKHYTLSRDLPGPDHPFALEPNQLKEMVDHIRYAETCLGNKKGFSESEQNFKSAMRSVVAKKPIKKGEIFTEDNLTTKRPFLEGNLAAYEWFNILGKESTQDYNEDEFIQP